MLDDAAMRDLERAEFDTGVSTFAVTEAPPEIRAWYGANVLSHSQTFLVVGQRRFHGIETGGFLDTLTRPFTLDFRPYLYEPLGWPSYEVLGTRRGE